MTSWILILQKSSSVSFIPSIINIILNNRCSLFMYNNENARILTTARKRITIFYNYKTTVNSVTTMWCNLTQKNYRPRRSSHQDLWAQTQTHKKAAVGEMTTDMTVQNIKKALPLYLVVKSFPTMVSSRFLYCVSPRFLWWCDGRRVASIRKLL